MHYRVNHWARRTGIWWHSALDGMRLDCPAEEMHSEDLLYILYTSGTTGRPNGIIHTTGGYMVGTYLTTLRLPGIDAAVVDERGAPVPPNTGGYLVLRRPRPR